MTDDEHRPAELPIDPDLTDVPDVLHRGGGRPVRRRRWDVALVIGAGGAIGGSGGLAGILPVLLPLLLQMFGGGSGGQTGMHKLLDGMHANGLGDVADSWVSGAPAKSITPAQAKQIVGPEKVKELSAQSGLPANQVAQGLSELLPNLVNHLTPNGQVPPAGQVQSAITGILGSLGL